MHETRVLLNTGYTSWFCHRCIFARRRRILNILGPFRFYHIFKNSVSSTRNANFQNITDAQRTPKWAFRIGKIAFLGWRQSSISGFFRSHFWQPARDKDSQTTKIDKHTKWAFRLHETLVFHDVQQASQAQNERFVFTKRIFCVFRETCPGALAGPFSGSRSGCRSIEV